jgi:poly(A) polymerase
MREWTPEDLNPDVFVTGHDLINLGVLPGPLYKRLLEAVREAQLDGTIKTRQEALELLRRLMNEVETSQPEA